jgi:endonuclease/exonuclease/phosphatase family metal-dependent hydrolase
MGSRQKSGESTGARDRSLSVRTRSFVHLLAWLAMWVGVGGCRDSAGGDGGDAAGPPPADPGGELALTVATFNVRYETQEDRGKRAWPTRLWLVVHALRESGAEVIGIQEALHGQVADLAASLPGFGFRGVGRDDGRRAGEYAALFWRRDRFTADPPEGGTFWLSDTPEQPGSRTWGNSVVRICTWQRLVDRATGRSLLVFNTHWDHQHQGSRERSARLIASRIDACRRPGEPVILLGDFNANEDNPAVRFLTGSKVALAGMPAEPWPGALIDAYATVHKLPANRRTLHFWTGRRDGPVKVDHVFASPPVRAAAAEILDLRRNGIMASDHYAVRASLVFPPTDRRGP